MKKLILLIVLIGLFSCTLYSQSYKTAIGARLGGQTNGVTIRHFTKSKTALEGILGIGYRSYVITGLYEKFVPIKGANGLNWFYGIGGHIGSFGGKGYYYYRKNKDYYGDRLVLGIDGIIGLDYKFKAAPINIGVDLKPFIDFYEGPFFIPDGGVNIRFIF